MRRSENSKTTLCPSCDARIYFKKTPRLGQVIVCRDCEERLEVVRLSPLKVDWSLLDDGEGWADMAFDNYDSDGNGQYDRY